MAALAHSLDLITRRVRRAFIAVTLFLSVASLPLLPGAATATDVRAIKLNHAAFDYASALIAQGRFVADKKGEWSDKVPSPASENEFLRRHGMEEYSKWYLGLDQRNRVGAKRSYRFPFGDFNVVHRAGLIAVINRARQFHYDDIAEAATRLKAAIDARAATSPMRSGRHR